MRELFNKLARYMDLQSKSRPPSHDYYAHTRLWLHRLPDRAQRWWDQNKPGGGPPIRPA